MHLTKQDFSFKDAECKGEKVKSLRETNLFLSLVLSCNSDPMVMVQGNLKAPTSLNKSEKGKRMKATKTNKSQPEEYPRHSGSTHPP